MRHRFILIMEISEKERDAGLEITILLTAEDEELMCFPLR